MTRGLIHSDGMKERSINMLKCNEELAGTQIIMCDAQIYPGVREFASGQDIYM